MGGSHEVDGGTTADGAVGGVAVICMSMIIGIHGLSDSMPIFVLTSRSIRDLRDRREVDCSCRGLGRTGEEAWRWSTAVTVNHGRDMDWACCLWRCFGYGYDGGPRELARLRTIEGDNLEVGSTR